MTKLSGGSIDDIVAEHIPLKRMGTKGDIALTAVFLATYVGPPNQLRAVRIPYALTDLAGTKISREAGGYITGETIVVDGGQWLYSSPMAPRDVIRELSRGYVCGRGNIGTRGAGGARGGGAREGAGDWGAREGAGDGGAREGTGTGARAATAFAGRSGEARGGAGGGAGREIWS